LCCKAQRWFAEKLRDIEKIGTTIDTGYSKKYSMLIKATPFIFLLLLAFSCSPIQVLDQEYADNFALNNYRTFDFYGADTSGAAVNSQAYNTSLAALKTEITQQLQKRGLQRGEHNPDLLVNIGIVISEKVRAHKSATGDPHYMGRRRYTWDDEQLELGQHYNEGTVTVHLVDRAQNTLVWRGVVEGIVPDKPARLQRNVADAMEELFRGL
jgi:hypothetical protein